MADFDAPKLMLTGLCEINLPEKDIRLCDGGFAYWGENKFQSADDEFGSIQDVEPISESVGDEAPGGRLTFLPVSTAAAATLSQPTYQGSQMRFWIGRVNEQTGLIDGDPELVFSGELDTTTLRIGRGSRALEMEYISIAERLFLVNTGNVLSPRFHKSIWPGETGMDAATGVGTVEPWGTDSPPRGTSSVGGGGGAPLGAGGLVSSLFAAAARA
jgi:hypothetical protein